MDWYEKKVIFHHDPKVRGLRTRLKNPLAECWLERIYCYCYQHETDRFSGDGAVGDIEDAAEWKGKTGALVSALIDTQFIDREGDCLVIHAVAERIEKAQTFRQQAADRKERFEQKRKAERAAATPPPAVPNAFQTSSERVQPADPERVRNSVPNLTRPDLTLPTGLVAAAATDPDATLAAEFNTAVCERLARTAPYPGDVGAVKALGAEVRRIGFAHAVSESTAIALARKTQGRGPTSLAWWVTVLKSLQPAGAAPSGKSRVTAPASNPEAFTKGGRVAL